VFSSTAQSVESSVLQVLAEITRDEAVLGMNLSTSLREDLGIDSMTSLTFLMALEDRIPGFVVDPATLEVEHFRTIGSICSYVRDQLARTTVTGAQPDVT
jgi:acyl carrier protein